MIPEGRGYIINILFKRLHKKHYRVDTLFIILLQQKLNLETGIYE